MKNYKIVVDRKPVSDEAIYSKQNFGEVLQGVKNLKPPLWKSAWFYGPVGLATVALTISATTIHANSRQDYPNQEKVSLSIVEQPKQENQTIVSPIEKDRLTAEIKEENVVLKIEKKAELKPKVIPSDFKEEKAVEIEVIHPKEKIIEEKITLAKFPNINNIFTGDITFKNLRSPEGITCGDKTITSFVIQYYNGQKDIEEQVVGNVIPEKTGELIERFNRGDMIYITQIKGVDKDGNNIVLPSLNFIPRY